MEQKEPSHEDESWKDNLDMNNLPVETQHTIKDMLFKYSSMWTGQLGEISITQHCIDLIPNAKPIYQE
jgi:hypothetical protein